MTLQKLFLGVLKGFFFFSVFGPASATGQTTSNNTQVSQFFQRICKVDADFETFIKYVGIPERHLETLAPTYKELWCSTFFEETFKTLVRKIGREPKSGELEAFGVRLGQHFLDQGTTLLDEAELVENFQIAIKVLNAMSTEECAAYVKRLPLGPPNYRTIFDITESMGGDVFNRYFELRRQAMKKILQTRGGWIAPSEEKLAYASGVYYGALRTLIKRRPDIGLAFNPEQKSDAAVCTRGKALTITFLVLPDDIKITAMRAFLSGNLGPPKPVGAE